MPLRIDSNAQIWARLPAHAQPKQIDDNALDAACAALSDPAVQSLIAEFTEEGYTLRHVSLARNKYGRHKLRSIVEVDKKSKYLDILIDEHDPQDEKDTLKQDLWRELQLAHLGIGYAPFNEPVTPSPQAHGRTSIDLTKGKGAPQPPRSFYRQEHNQEAIVYDGRNKQVYYYFGEPAKDKGAGHPGIFAYGCQIKLKFGKEMEPRTVASPETAFHMLKTNDPKVWNVMQHMNPKEARDFAKEKFDERYLESIGWFDPDINNEHSCAHNMEKVLFARARQDALLREKLIDFVTRYPNGRFVEVNIDTHNPNTKWALKPKQDEYTGYTYLEGQNLLGEIYTHVAKELALQKPGSLRAPINASEKISTGRHVSKPIQPRIPVPQTPPTST